MDWIHAEHFISIDPEYAGKIFVNGCERKCFRIRGIFRNDAGLSISIDPEYAGKIFVNGCERKCFRIRGIFRNDAGLS